MSSSSKEIIPEKFSMYFSTLNSLASKIYSEIQMVDDNIKSSIGEVNYDTRCAIIDQHLIHNELHLKNRKSKKAGSHQALIDQDVQYQREENIESKFNDDALHELHTDSLIHFVYPKKPEKYVFDENRSWIDEHSEPFSYVKLCQTQACGLEKLKNSAMTKKNVHSINPPKSSTVSTGSTMSSIPNAKQTLREPKKETVAKSPSNKLRFGVSILGGLSEPREIQPNKLNTDKVLADPDLESNLPNQVQNSDLIAELQAKLNKGKIGKTMTSPPPLPPNTDSIKRSKPIPNNQNHTNTGKILKPKAPPPPPPQQKSKQQASATKDRSVLTPETPKDNTSETVRQNSNIKDDFSVDVSSPCRIATPKTGFDFLDNW